MLDGRAENHGPDGGTSGFTADQQYFYDGLNRLDTAEEKISSTETWKQTFTFDRYGNRRIDAANTTAPANCTSAICNPTFSTATNRISSSGYAYDADGNLTQNAAGERFGYDQENRQKEFYVNGNNGSTPDATYSYDGEGRRVKKISSTETTVFVYDGTGRMIAEYSTALAQTQQVSYLTTDHLGSPRLITNENGAVTKRQDFGAFGDERLTAQRAGGLGYASTDELRQDYTGYQKDNESGLEYAQARYYNTAHGRFTSVDPLTASATIRDPQSFNRYSYVLNSPYKFTDPLGLAARTSGSFCAQWCQNSGPTVDGSAFRGKDTSMGANLLAALDLERQVRNALDLIEQDKLSFGSGVTGTEKQNIRYSLERMLKGPDNGTRQFVAQLVNGGVVFDVGATVSGASGEASINNVAGINQLLQCCSNTPDAFMRFFTITIDRATWAGTKQKWRRAFIDGNLLHEMYHVLVQSMVLATWGTSNHYNPTQNQEEYEAKVMNVRYLIAKGGAYVSYGKFIQFIDPKTGKIDTNSLSIKSNVSQTHTMQYLINNGVVFPGFGD